MEANKRARRRRPLRRRRSGRGGRWTRELATVYSPRRTGRHAATEPTVQPIPVHSSQPVSSATRATNFETGRDALLQPDGSKPDVKGAFDLFEYVVVWFISLLLAYT